MIKLYTFAHKRPDFIELQLQSFRLNLKEPFEFIVFNNASFDPNKKHYNEIKAVCVNNNIQCIDIQKDQETTAAGSRVETCAIFNDDGTYSNSCIACAYPLYYAWKNYISKTDDKICIIDSDMFIVQPIVFSDILRNNQLCFVPQSRSNKDNTVFVHYMWNGFILADLKTLPDKQDINWWCGAAKECSVDVGGQTYKYLESHTNLNTMHIPVHYVSEDSSADFDPVNYELLWLDGKKTVLHYRGGSNWDGKSHDYHFKKTRWLKTQIK